MRADHLTQLPLPLDVSDTSPRLASAAASLEPDSVWETIPEADRIRVRMVWLRVMGEVTDEEPGEGRTATP